MYYYIYFQAGNSSLTCIRYAVILTLAPHVVDDYDPHERGAHHTANHHHYNDADRRPAVLTVNAGHRVAVGRGGDGKIDVASLSAERVGHDARVFPSVGRSGVYDNEKLIGRCKEVAFRQHQRSIVFGPVEPWGGATSSYALEDGSLATCDSTILERALKGWRFCNTTEKIVRCYIQEKTQTGYVSRYPLFQ